MCALCALLRPIHPIYLTKLTTPYNAKMTPLAISRVTKNCG
jgi:hypothetical protein